MWEAIEESGWNAVALPIPVNASKELLIEMYNWTTSFVQLYLDDVRDHRCLSDPKPDDPKYLKAEERLKLASRRETQIEWRLNVMGLFHSNSRDWAPAADNEYVKETIERWPIPITDTICRLIENSI